MLRRGRGGSVGGGKAEPNEVDIPEEGEKGGPGKNAPGEEKSSNEPENWAMARLKREKIMRRGAGYVFSIHQLRKTIGVRNGMAAGGGGGGGLKPVTHGMQGYRQTRSKSCLWLSFFSRLGTSSERAFANRYSPRLRTSLLPYQNNLKFSAVASTLPSRPRPPTL